LIRELKDSLNDGNNWRKKKETTEYMGIVTDAKERAKDQ
jgi:hypothetical protein